GPQKDDRGAFDVATAQIRVARHIQAVAGKFDAVEGQRSLGPDVSRKRNPLTILEGSALASYTDGDGRMTRDLYTANAHGLQIAAVVPPWFDTPRLEIPLDITSRDTQALGE